MSASFDVIFRGALVVDGSGKPGFIADVAIRDGKIVEVGSIEGLGDEIDAQELVLAPGFIDVHTHDDTVVIRQPEMLPKISQGVTTVVVGNCGISASPVRLQGAPPDPMNLLGDASCFSYPQFSDYVAAIEHARPTVNVIALVGHTALRNNHLNDLQQPATTQQIEAMREDLREALSHGATGLSSGLAYGSANAAPTEEVQALARELAEFGGVYATHMRTEFEGILDAMDEAFAIGKSSRSPVIISHLKCAGARNWGRSEEVLRTLDSMRRDHPVGCDCYPYTAGSSTLDLKQVTADFEILITWSEPHPEMAGKTLQTIGKAWNLSLMDTAKKLRPAGAVYHNMDESDVKRILRHPASMIGSDGLPEDPLPHPRLWGAFPRVLGHYSRDLGLFPLHEAVRKMTGLSASRFGLTDRGLVRQGYWADLVLFDPKEIRDTARFGDPIHKAQGIHSVWVNGVLSYRDQEATGLRGGRFLPRTGPSKEFP